MCITVFLWMRVYSVTGLGMKRLTALHAVKRSHRRQGCRLSSADKAAFDLITNFTQGTIPKNFLTDYSPGSAKYTQVWDDIIETADRFNEPGRFTALIGLEWTSIPKGNNLHRNVILRDNDDRARQVTPLGTQPPLGNTDPLVLYKWLEDYEKKTGDRAAAEVAGAEGGANSNGFMACRGARENKKIEKVKELKKYKVTE